MPSTIVVAVRQKVRDGLLALTGAAESLENVSVTYCWDPDSRAREQIFTLSPSGETPPAALRAGRNFRNETAKFRIVIHVEKVAGDAEAGDLRAVALGLVVEEFLADRKSNELGVTGLQNITVTSWELTGGPADGAYISQLIYTVTYNARLT